MSSQSHSGAPGARHALGALLAVGALASPALADFAYSDFTNPTGLNLTLSASTSDGLLHVTKAVPDQAGGAWSGVKQSVAGGFTTTFSFRVSAQGGIGPDPTGHVGADGLALVIQNQGGLGPEFSMPITGGGLGFNGMSNILAVEFDTWMNIRANDPDANHISILTNGLGSLTPSQDYSI